MKNIVLAFGLAAMSAPSFAQEHDHHHAYQKSVFAGHELITSVNRERADQVRPLVKKNFPGWKLDVDKITGEFSDIYGDAITVPGNSPEEKSKYLLGNSLKQLGIENSQWKMVRNSAAPKAHYVDYEQYVDSRMVMFSRMSFRFTSDHRLVRVKNRSFGTTKASSAPVLAAADVKASQNITEGAAGLNITTVTVAGDWVWFPVPAKNGYSLHPAWEFTAMGTNEERMPVELNGFIDAVDGSLLYRTNEVKEIEVEVKGTVFKNNTVTPATLEPLGHIELQIGSATVNANDTGYYSNAAPSANVTVLLKGKWSTVIPAGGSTPTFSQLIAGTDVISFPSTGANSRAVNAYYHTTRAHDNMKMLLPSFTNMDISLTTNVELTTGSCNAFYSGGANSINFYAPGGGCPSFAEIGDIVYHEYGHGINRNFYNAEGASSMRNGALNEGYADVWGMTITKDSVLGRNSKGSPATFIRRYDQNHKVYPKDIVGEVHADGEIIAGAWWDVARNIGSYDAMAQLFAEAFYDVADGPNGMEGPIFHDVLISAILSDDDDATLSNGTPNLNAIITAFAKHGIYLYANAELIHNEVAHPAANTPVTVNAKLNLTNSDFFQSLKLIYRNRAVGTWDTVAMTDNGGFNFTGQIPGQSVGAIIDYFFYIYDVLAIPTVTLPDRFGTDPTMTTEYTLPFQFAVGVSPRIKIDFETDIDWDLGLADDNATTGDWEQEVPVGTFYSPNGGAFGSFITQTNKDHTTGTGKCLLTANGSTSYNAGDVDNGKTTAMTPFFDLGGYVSPVIEYYRWFSNDRNGSGGEGNRRNDYWRVDMRSSPTTVLWQQVENTRQSDHNWRRRVVAVDQVIPGQRNIQLRFVATDAGDQSIVEAGVDDFFIYDAAPVSVKNIAHVKAQVFPNPANEKITVALPAALAGTISLYDLTGKVLSTIQMDSVARAYDINTKSIAPGQYMLVIQGDNKTIQSQKVVVAH